LLYRPPVRIFFDDFAITPPPGSCTNGIEAQIFPFGREAVQDAPEVGQKGNAQAPSSEARWEAPREACSEARG
jgi:hypothetical protein